MTIDQIGLFLANIVVAAVDNRTGLDGLYAFTLTFSRQRSAGVPVNANPSDDLPDVFTAVQEQLGLKLQRGKKTLPFYGLTADAVSTCCLDCRPLVHSLRHVRHARDSVVLVSVSLFLYSFTSH